WQNSFRTSKAPQIPRFMTGMGSGRFVIVRFWKKLKGFNVRINTMTTAILHHPIFKEHDTGPGHPESPSRYSVVMEALRSDEELWSKLREVQATQAARGDIQAAHSPQLYKHIERVVSEG